MIKTEVFLARSRKGVGSLTLTIDERGLHYSFDAPTLHLEMNWLKDSKEVIFLLQVLLSLCW